MCSAAFITGVLLLAQMMFGAGWAFSSPSVRGSAHSLIATHRPSYTPLLLSLSASSSTTDIEEAERELRWAMLSSNVTTLDHLLDDKLIFTNHMGITMGKQDDLEAHRTANGVDIQELTLSDMVIQLLGDTTAVVTVAARIKGSFRGDSFQDTLRFTRIWHQANDSWRVVAAHSSVVQELVE